MAYLRKSSFAQKGTKTVTHRVFQMIQKYPQVGLKHWLKMLQTVENWFSHYFLKNENLLNREI